MRIEEMTVGSGVTLYINFIGDQQLMFETRITDVIPKRHQVLAEGIIRDGKVLSFRSKGISIDAVVAMGDGKPMLFQDIRIEVCKVAENTYCYNLIQTKDGIPFNRRKNYRCFVGNPSLLRNGADLSEYEVIIRDVSLTGFAITCDTGLELNNNQLVHVFFEDYIEELDEKFAFQLYGLVARRQELEHGKIVYGCRLNNNVVGLDNYLNKKERIRIRRSRGR